MIDKRRIVMDRTTFFTEEIENWYDLEQFAVFVNRLLKHGKKVRFQSEHATYSGIIVDSFEPFMEECQYELSNYGYVSFRFEIYDTI